MPLVKGCSDSRQSDLVLTDPVTDHEFQIRTECGIGVLHVHCTCSTPINRAGPMPDEGSIIQGSLLSVDRWHCREP
jgi:hypothetical protein